MAVTMAEISKLRKLTGAGMMDCKNALTETNGDIEAAKEIIRKKGQAVAAKREDREASEGCVLAAAKGDFAAIVALKCETDFVAKNDSFVALTKSILDAAIEAKATDLETVILPGTSKPRKPVLPMKTCSFSRPLQTRKHSRLDRKANRRLLTAIPQTEIHSCVRTPFLSSTFKTISCRAAPLPFREATESSNPSAI